MYISRIAKDGREQLTADHLLETAEYAGTLGAKFGLSATARTTALLHDLGKCSDEFVNYLRLSAQCGERAENAPHRGSIIHSTQGARYIYEAGQCEKRLSLPAEAIALAITGHHGTLMDGVSPHGETPLRNRLINEKHELHYNETVTAFEEEITLTENPQDWLSTCQHELSAFIKKCQSKGFNCAFMLHLLVKSVFSCLVDSDRYNAFCFETGKAPEAQLSVPPWDEYALRLEQSISAIPVDSEIARIRHDISERCRAAASYPCGIYRLSVPTGGGKTLSSLRFALHHAKEHNKEHIIYVIPYLSILDQTAREIKKALQFRKDEEFILEHHSSVVLPENGRHEGEAQAYRLFTDRWSQPIIITTLVQFLESIYSNRSSKLRKLHNMANAVLIFDEVQSLPVKCVYLFNDALNYLHFFGNSTILLCTATQPLIDKVEHVSIYSPRELIPNQSEAFNKMKRTRIVDNTIKGGYSTLALRDFVLEKLRSAGNCLVILNTRKDAANLFCAVRAYLNEIGEKDITLVHLSTLMCAAHRKEAIDAMQEYDGTKKVLKRERILCISTQLIEAGVDISFACVIRALAGLDSVAQAAGRCNRNGEHPHAREVYVVNLEDENLSRLPDINCGHDVTFRIFSEPNDDDILSRTVMDRYYKEYFFKRQGVMDYPSEYGSIYDLLSDNPSCVNTYLNSINPREQPEFPELRQSFHTAGEQFCVIEKGPAGVLVPYERGEQLADAYKNAGLKDKPRLLREIGAYSVSLYQYQIELLKREGALRLIGDEILVLDKDYYDLKLGVVFHQEPAFLNI